MRVEQLTFTRFLAASAIVVFHYGLDVFPFNLKPIASIFQNAPLAVSYFFMLSGFVLMISVQGKERIHFWNFTKNRLLRIYPEYILSALVMMAYLILSNNDFSLIEFAINISLTQAWIPGYALLYNPPSWSISVEIFFYLLLPLLVHFVYRRIPLSWLTLIAVLFIILVNFFTNYIFYSERYTGFPSAIHDLLHYFPLMHLGSFVLGSLAAIYYLQNKRLQNWDLMLLFLLTMIYFLLSAEFSINAHNGGLFFLIIPFIVVLAKNSGYLSRSFKWRPFVLLGEISYGIYIYQEPVFCWIRGGLSKLEIESKELNFFIPFLVLLILSLLSFYFVQKPIVRRFKVVDARQEGLKTS
jgi:peptidoglycan/LPS O-acetylase OafA/YrhL